MTFFYKRVMSNIISILLLRAKYYCAYMKNKLRDINQETQLLALDFLDYSMDDGKMPLWTQVSSKDFLSSLVNLLKTRDAPEVNNKILYLIEKWGKKFEKYNTIIPGFSDMYIHLRDSGVQFPQGMQSTYSKYIMTEEAMSAYNNNPKNYNNDYMNNNDYDDSENNSSSGNITGKNYVNSIHLDLKTSSYEKKYRKLVEKLSTLTKEIGMANEYIDKSKGSSFEPTLLTIIDDLKVGNKQLIETIQSDKLKSESLMEISLGISDDINRTLSRFSVIKKKGKPEPFLSSFIERTARSKGNDYGYSKPSKSNDNYKPSKQVDLLDTFDNPQIPVSNNIQQKPQENTVNDLLDIFSNPQPVQQQQETIPQNNGPYPNFMNNNNSGNVGGINMDLQLGFGNVLSNNNTNNMLMPNITQSQSQPQNDLFSALSGTFGQSGNNNNMMMTNTNPTNSFGTNPQSSNPNPMDFNFSMASQPKPQPISNTTNMMNIANIQQQSTNFDFSMPKPTNTNFMTLQPKSTNTFDMGTSMNTNIPQQNSFNTSSPNTMGLNMNYSTQQQTNNANSFSLGMMPNQNKDINFNFSMPTTNTTVNNQQPTQSSNVLDSLF